MTRPEPSQSSFHTFCTPKSVAPSFHSSTASPGRSVPSTR